MSAVLFASYQFDDRSQQAQALATRVADFVGKAKAESRHVVVALAGGGTPRLSYQLLGQKLEEKSAWGAVDFILTDERLMPLDDSRCNDKMLHETLGENALILPLVRGKNAPALDLAVLGMGEDGHIASIFSLSRSFNAPEIYLVKPGSPLENRLTLPMAAFVSAEKVILLLAGDEKYRALTEFMAESKSTVKFICGRVGDPDRKSYSPDTRKPVRVLFDLRRENGKSEVEVFYAP